MKSIIVTYSLLSCFLKPLPNCCIKIMFDSVFLNNITWLTLGMSIPSLKISTVRIYSISLFSNSSTTLSRVFRLSSPVKYFVLYPFSFNLIESNFASSLD